MKADSFSFPMKEIKVEVADRLYYDRSGTIRTNRGKWADEEVLVAIGLDNETFASLQDSEFSIELIVTDGWVADAGDEYWHTILTITWSRRDSGLHPWSSDSDVGATDIDFGWRLGRRWLVIPKEDSIPPLLTIYTPDDFEIPSELIESDSFEQYAYGPENRFRRAA